MKRLSVPGVLGAMGIAISASAAEVALTCKSTEEYILTHSGGKLRQAERRFDPETPLRLHVSISGDQAMTCLHWQKVKTAGKNETSSRGSSCDGESSKGYKNLDVVSTDLSSSSRVLQIVLEPQVKAPGALAEVTYTTVYPEEKRAILVRQETAMPLGGSAYYQTSYTYPFTCE